MTETADFWSRRRAAVAAEAQADEAARATEAQAEEEARLAERTDEDLLEDLGLPEPEVMERPEQVQALLREAVPQRLKTRALRRLWRLNPILANVDGLVDYGEDFTDAAMVVENMQTVYQVGKGMFDKVAELAEQAEKAEQAKKAKAAETDDGEAPAPEPEEAEPAQAPELAVALAAPAPETNQDPAPEQAAALPPSSRRMRFAFDA